ncbi:MAG: AbrB/MazE/SpoVT family DNA-binding domain-containing protein [Terracidiphilus sp.]
MKDNDNISENVKSRVNANGRIVIPFRIRRAMGLEPGDTVAMTLEGGVLRIEPHQAKVKRIQDALKKFVRPDASASEELASERRDESRIEMEEWLG